MIERETYPRTTLQEFLIDDKLKEELESIPDRLAFKIGDVSEMLDLKQYVLRYWESEFDGLRPRKSKNGQRIYSRRDVETLFIIRKLLHRDKFSIQGARAQVRQIRRELKDLPKTLNDSSHNTDMHTHNDSTVGAQDLGQQNLPNLQSIHARLEEIRTELRRMQVLFE